MNKTVTTMIFCLLTLCLLTQEVNGRGGGRKRDKITYSGWAVSRDEFGEQVRVQADQCPGGCALNDVCMDDIPLSEAELQCKANAVVVGVGSIIGLCILTLVFVCVIYKCVISPRIKALKASRGSIYKAKDYDKPTHVNPPGTAIGMWPYADNSILLDNTQLM